MKEKINAFYRRHEAYLNRVYKIVFYIMVVGSVIDFIYFVIKTAFVDKNVAGLLALVIFQSIIITGRALIGTVIWGTVVAIALFPIHLILRKKTKPSNITGSQLF